MLRRTFLVTSLGLCAAAELACAGGSTTKAAKTNDTHASRAATVIYIVRHAEKQVIEGESDPALTAKGAARAEALRDTLNAPGSPTIELVISSQYQRTRATVAPLAASIGLEVQIVDAGDGPALAQRLLDLKNTRALVAGHSNTVPALIEALGVARPVVISDDQYGDLFVVTLAEGAASLEVLHFGAE